jgi:hypothetical protein
MKYKAGDTVRIRSKEWMDKQKKNSFLTVMPPEGCRYEVNEQMQELAGETAKIESACYGCYLLDLDRRQHNWEDWMFDPDYAGPLSAKEAVKAMTDDGETLYDEDGTVYFWQEADSAFMYRKQGEDKHFRATRFNDLSREPPKRKRLMTRWEVLAWAGSTESHGWLVKSVADNAWELPQFCSYAAGDLRSYKRARLLPDLSGIDEATVCGFEAGV